MSIKGSVFLRAGGQKFPGNLPVAVEEFLEARRHGSWEPFAKKMRVPEPGYHNREVITREGLFEPGREPLHRMGGGVGIRFRRQQRMCGDSSSQKRGAAFLEASLPPLVHLRCGARRSAHWLLGCRGSNRFRTGSHKGIGSTWGGAQNREKRCEN